MAGAIYHLQHNTIGRKTHAAGSVRAHANYILRKSALTAFVAIGFSSHGHAFKREISAYEESVTRKNARLSDNIHFALPRCMTPEQHRAVALAFGWRLTDGGRARAGIAIHHGGGNNPHVHVLFIDKDRETGETVSKLSISPRDRRKLGLEPNATKWLRELWEDTCNRRLEEWGYEQRISCKPRERLLEEELSSDVAGHDEGSPEVHTEGLPEEEEAAFDRQQLQELSQYPGNPGQLDTPPHAPTETLEEHAPEEQAEALVEPEPDMAELPRVSGNNGETYFRDERLREWRNVKDPHEIYRFDDVESIFVFGDPEQLNALDHTARELKERVSPDEQPPRIVAGKKPESVAGKVKGSIELAKRSRELRGAKSRLQTALDWHDKAVAAQGVATVAHRQLENDITEFNEQHRGPMGRGLAGFNVFGWKILGRKEAETAQARVVNGQTTYKALYDSWAEKKRQAERLEASTQADHRQIEGYARMSPEERRQALQGMEQASDIIDRTHAETLESVSAVQVYEAFKRGELTADEAMETCAYLGDRVFAARIAQEAELEEEQDLGM